MDNFRLIGIAPSPPSYPLLQLLIDVATSPHPFRCIFLYNSKDKKNLDRYESTLRTSDWLDLPLPNPLSFNHSCQLVGQAAPIHLEAYFYKTKKKQTII